MEKFPSPEDEVGVPAEPEEAQIGDSEEDLEKRFGPLGQLKTLTAHAEEMLKSSLKQGKPLAGIARGNEQVVQDALKNVVTAENSLAEAREIMDGMQRRGEKVPASTKSKLEDLSTKIAERRKSLDKRLKDRPNLDFTTDYKKGV
jgi:hypothetical protein